MLVVTRSCPTCRQTYPDAAFFCGADGAITIQDQDARDTDARLGKRLGDYILVARVADGAMGRVFEGRHRETRARVAIKVLHTSVLRDRVAVERFRREYETTRELAHPYIVRMIEFVDSSEEGPCLVMEFLEGEQLGELLRRGKLLPWARTLRIVCQVALALEHAHSFGFIHRDLKPENIFLCAAAGGDEVRILDFGSVKLQLENGSKLTAAGTTVGSPFYMSPEQAMGRSDVDPSSDVFALGAIVHEMLTGEVAFHASNVAKILLRILNDHPPPPSQLVPALPRAVDAVLRRALAKEKTERQASAREFAADTLAAFGLVGGVEAWAARPLLEMENALVRAGAVPDLGSTVRMQAPDARLLRSQSAAASDAAPAGVHTGRQKLLLCALGLLFAAGLLAALLQ